MDAIIQEYPKMLYRDNKHRLVDGPEEEETARAEGWHLYTKDGKPPKDESAPKAARKGAR